MRCDEARAQLRAGAEGREALEHLEGCPACFAAVEAADPLAAALTAARPAPVPVPAGLAARLQASPATGWPRSRRSAGGRLPAAAALAVAVAIELVVGAEPARLAGLGGSLLVVAGVVPSLLEPLRQVRSALLDAPALLGLLVVAAAGVSGLWLRLALQPPARRWAR